MKKTELPQHAPLTEGKIATPLEKIDFTTVKLDDLVNNAIFHAKHKALLEDLKIPSDADQLEGAGKSTIVFAILLRMSTVLAKLQARVFELETLLQASQPDRIGGIPVDPLVMEDPSRRALRALKTPNPVHFSVSELALGKNWYETEQANDRHWVWSGPGLHSTIMIPLGDLERGMISITLSAFGKQTIKETFEMVKPTFYLDTQKLEFEGLDSAKKPTQATLTAPFHLEHGVKRASIVLHIYLEGTQQISKNQRYLGLCLRSISLAGVTSSGA